MEPSRPFSERMGLVPVVVQTDGMNDALRNSIWNFISRLLEMPREQKRYGDTNRTLESVRLIADAILGIPIQEIPHHWAMETLLMKFKTLPWPRVYDALEY